MVMLLVCAVSFAAENLSGTYTIQGAKGAVVLQLRQDADGNVQGSLKGGELALLLKGAPRQEGGVLGTAMTGGQLASFFVAVKQGDQLLFDLVQIDADGEPDMTKRQTIAFDIKSGGNAQEPAADTLDTDTAQAPASDAAEATTPGAKTFAGTFKGDDLTLESRAKGNDFTGTLSVGGQKMPFTGTGVNGTLHGTFETGGERFDFTARWQGAKLVLQSGEATYTLQKQGAAVNPLAKPKPKPAKNPLDKAKGAATAVKTAPSPSSGRAAAVTKTQGAPIGGAAWKTFKHQTGLSLRYPPTWTTKDAGEALLLTPPDVRQVNGGPLELFVVMASPSGPIRSGDDPRMEQHIEQSANQVLQGFTRTGQTMPIKVGTAPGIVMTWEGAVQGAPARAQVYATVLKNFGIALLTISAKDQIKPSRDATAKQIFESLVAGAGEKDPRIAGSWFLYSYKNSGTYGSGRETKSYMTLLPDGTAIWGQQSEAAYIGETGGVATQGSSSDRGSWSAANGQLIVAWGDGTTAAWSYRVGGGTGAGRRLFLTGSSGKEDEWMER
jgi:hypothetical protein